MPDPVVVVTLDQLEAMKNQIREQEYRRRSSSASYGGRDSQDDPAAGMSDQEIISRARSSSEQGWVSGRD